uniref:Deoxyribonuclease-1-like 1 n=1 Tax=Suricata suricatta TaxID=37032 RepID=A0A673TTE2_SURSU
MGSGCHGDKVSLWSHKQVLKLIAVMVAQPVNVLNATELCFKQVISKLCEFYFNKNQVLGKRLGRLGPCETGLQRVPLCQLLSGHLQTQIHDMRALLPIPWSPRSHKTQVLDSYVYKDEDDLFAREPFVAQFTFPSKVLPHLVLVPLHASPKAVEKELNALYDVFLDVSERWQSKDMILLGDFNADCGSLTKKRLGELVLRTQEGFQWVIPDDEDTTVRASTHCAYDRIVLHGERYGSLLRSAAAFDFPRSFGLTEEEALNVSDHYPVEVELSRAVHRAQPLGLAAALLLLLLLLP